MIGSFIGINKVYIGIIREKQEERWDKIHG